MVEPSTENTRGLAETRVVITGIDVPISDLAVLLIKLFFASIPVSILVGLIWLLLQMRSL